MEGITLDDFTWDDVKFFEEEKPEEKPEEVKSEEKEKKPEKVEKVEKIDKKEDEEETFFEETDEDFKMEVTEKPSKLTESGNAALNTLKFLKEKELINFDEELTNEITDEEVEELLETKFEESIENRLEDMFEDLPDYVKEMNRIALKNGDVLGYLKALVPIEMDIDRELNMEEEDDQELVVRRKLYKQGYSKDYVDTQIEFLKDTGKLKIIAEEENSKDEKEREAERKRIAKQAEDNKRLEKENTIKAKRRVSEYIDKITDVNGIPLNKDLKKILPSYIMEKTYKLPNGTEISEFQSDLFQALSDQNIALQLALLLKKRDKNGNFDFSFIAKEAETTVTKKIKEDIRRQKDTISASGGSSQKKPLADYFN